MPETTEPIEIMMPPKFCHWFSRDHKTYWFRIRGNGMVIHWDKNRRPLFSERMGIVKFWKFGPIHVRLIKAGDS